MGSFIPIAFVAPAGVMGGASSDSPTDPSWPCRHKWPAIPLPQGLAATDTGL